ncbi:hypothetical protein SLS62_007015 [Diatrype stigma]|uniref:Uncharacterized protein n=1 Tax=Diatrype stigma TaxID=117547 RepID=A0AAN9URM3_9PEZI
MASDDDYMAFLNKANEDPSAGVAPTAKTAGGKKGNKDKVELKATDEGAQVPAAILDATKDAFYVSDADEPFVPVCLAWDGDADGEKGLPDEEEFATLIQHPNPGNAGIEIQDPADWDPRGQYAAILDAVRKATRGNDARVYRVPHLGPGGGARVEYWVVAAEEDGSGKGIKRLVGAKALAVES